MGLRVVSLIVCLLAASAAQAEDWDILHWSQTTGMIALEAGRGRASGEDRVIIRQTRLTKLPTSSEVEAIVTEQEIDCAEQRVRERSRQGWRLGKPVGPNRLIGPWRDNASEPDRFLIVYVCRLESWGVPLVRDVSLEEASRALAAAATNSERLASDPSLVKWDAAFTHFRPKGPPVFSVPSIALAMQSPHEWEPAEVGSDFITLATKALKVADGRFRWHEILFQPQKDPKVAAVWVYREVDCARAGTRMLAYAAVDRQGEFIRGADQTMSRSEYETFQDGSEYAGFIEEVCRNKRVAGERPSTFSNLKEAILGFETFHHPSTGTIAGGGPKSPWRSFYRELCGPAGCEIPYTVRWAPVRGL